MRDTSVDDDDDDDDDVVLGEDWVDPKDDEEAVARRRRGRFLSLNSSPLARRIITFNLIALVVLVSGVLYINPFRDSLVAQRERSLVAEAQLIAEVFEAGLPATQPDLVRALGLNAEERLRELRSSAGVDIYLFQSNGNLIMTTATDTPAAPVEEASDGNFITGALSGLWNGLSSLFRPDGPIPGSLGEDQARALVPRAIAGGTHASTGIDTSGATVFAVATPVSRRGAVLGVVALTSASGEIDALVRSEREQVLQVFVMALLVSIGLSLVLASTIANPLSDLAAAAEVGRDRDSRKVSTARVRIPDLTARPDEIGRLSGAMRGMVAALYDRIEGNEQFAADVAHEIKNPLASLRSAIGTLRIAKRDDQRDKLLDVVEHDVRRLDRLVSDISNASRLDSELVKEEEESFDLIKMLANITGYFGEEAKEKGVEFITDLPSRAIVVTGLEQRLAQVFVNIVSNAVSFCEDGDAVRVWARKRDNRVLVVVEDTGPGIPETALHKIFNRFYSERPVGQFGNHSGLGLAISKQIVEAHGGVIWAENIRPTDADLTSEPLGARFVVGLPV